MNPEPYRGRRTDSHKPPKPPRNGSTCRLGQVIAGLIIYAVLTLLVALAGQTIAGMMA